MGLPNLRRGEKHVSAKISGKNFSTSKKALCEFVFTEGFFRKFQEKAALDLAKR